MPSTPGSPIAPRALEHSPGWLLFLALPVLMAIANKSAPLILVVAAVVANLAALQRGPRGALAGRYRGLLRTGTVLLLALLCGLAILSLLWTIDPASTRRALIEAIPEFLAAFALAAAWPLLGTGRDVALLRYGLLAAVAVVLFEAYGGMPIHRLVGARAEIYDLKRSAAAVAVLLWPALAVCMARRDWTWAIVLVLATLASAIAGHASASVVAVTVSLIVVALASIWPRATFAGMVAAGLAALAAAPWTGTLTSSILSPDWRGYLARQHADIRLDLWTNFEAHIRERWLSGHGFGASQVVSASPLLDHARDIPMVWNVHPHNFLLQIWVEFGVLGAAAAAVSFGYLMSRLARLNSDERAVRLGFLSSAGSIALVGNSAWAPWWLATCAVSLVSLSLLHTRVDGELGHAVPHPSRVSVSS